MQNKTALASTKVGRRFMGFMAVFNSGDREKLQEYIAEYTTDEGLAKQPVEEWTGQLERIHAATEGMRVYQVVASDEYKVVLLMQAHNNGALYFTEMAVSEDYPHKIAEFIHRPAAS